MFNGSQVKEPADKKANARPPLDQICKRPRLEENFEKSDVDDHGYVLASALKSAQTGHEEVTADTSSDDGLPPNVGKFFNNSKWMDISKVDSDSEQDEPQDSDLDEPQDSDLYEPQDFDLEEYLNTDQNFDPDFDQDELEYITDAKKGHFRALMQGLSSTAVVTNQGIHELQNALSRCPDEGELAEDPIGLRISLMLHQKKALKWMIYREGEKPAGGILADDMGLGKTLTIIALIVHSISIERRQNSLNCDLDSADSGDDWDARPVIPSKGRKKAKTRVCRKFTSDGSTLVVCPPTLLHQWEIEIREHTNSGLLSVLIHHGPHRTTDPEDLCTPDIVITTYSLLEQNSHILNKVYWKRVVLDEAHQIRNPKTQVSESACKLKSHKRWVVTGTPVHNKPLDIFSLLKFLRCDPWDDIKVWNSTMRGGRSGMVRLTTLLRSLTLRRTKEGLQKSGEMTLLPPKILQTIELELDEQEARVYKTLLAYSRTLFAQFLLQRDRRAGRPSFSVDQLAYKARQQKRGSKDFRSLTEGDNISKELFDELNKALLNTKGDIEQCHILVLLLRLRQICDHPALISKTINKEEVSQVGANENASNKKGDFFSKALLSQESSSGSWSDMSGNPMRLDNPVFKEDYESSKMVAIMQALREILPTGDKVIIVSQWTSMLGLIKEHLIQAGESRYAMFTGKLEVSKRQAIVNQFNNQRDGLKILLLSLTAGGQGLSLFGGNHLIMVDNHWNPQLENQAQDRIYRCGQTKIVNIYKFLCKGTIEQRVKDLQDRKLKLANDIFTGISLTSTKLTLADLKQLFQM